MRVINLWDLKSESVQPTVNGLVFNQHVGVRQSTHFCYVCVDPELKV